MPSPARERRVALVIGNGSYRGGGFSVLPNPVNDATDIRAALARMGFEVEFGVDLDRNAMDLALVRFVRRAADADVALVFFAGHGLQHDGINYMVPIDAAVDDAASLRLLPTAQNLLRDLRPERGARILVLDACRDTPVVNRLQVATRGTTPSRGLARMADVEGALVAFAAQPGAVASDGEGRNSPFTTALLRHLPTPGQDLRITLAHVRTDVLRSTGGRQRPEVTDSIAGELVLTR